MARPPSLAPNLADNLRAWREARGLSQAEAAEALCVSPRTLQGWEAGRPCEQEGMLRRLMALLPR